MPKGQKKKGGNRRGGRMKEQNGYGSEDDYDTNDSCSVVSNQSETQSGDGEDVELTIQESLEDKLIDAIDGLTTKSSKVRMNNLNGIIKIFTHNYMAEFIESRIFSLYDAFEKVIKKGKDEEMIAAANALVLEMIQIPYGECPEKYYKDIYDTLRVTIQDKTMCLRKRSTFCYTLAHMILVMGLGYEHIIDGLTVFESVFKGAYLKGNKEPPTISSELSQLYIAALSGWSLLLSISQENIVVNIAYSTLTKLHEILEISHLDLKLAAGEAIALIYGIMRESDEDFDGDDMDDLCDRLRELAQDYNKKSQGKKEKRQQRSGFREISKAVESNENPYQVVKFGMESITINSWAEKRQYDSLVQILGTGLNTHLRDNITVRSILNLGDPIPAIGLKMMQKPSKLERQHYNDLHSKMRTISRAKSRDKRSAHVVSDS